MGLMELLRCLSPDYSQTILQVRVIVKRGFSHLEIRHHLLLSDFIIEKNEGFFYFGWIGKSVLEKFKI